MKSIPITPLERKNLKARAHFLDPVVMIGDAGLTPAVLREIERNLAVHELIKVRVAGQEREARVALCEEICSTTGAASIQHIGKLLVLYLRAPDVPEKSAPPAKKTAQRRPVAAKRNPVSGRVMAARPGQVPPSTRKTPSGIRPPRTARVRKSGQRSAKKPFQDS